MEQDRGKMVTDTNEKILPTGSKVDDWVAFEQRYILAVYRIKDAISEPVWHSK